MNKDGVLLNSYLVFYSNNGKKTKFFILKSPARDLIIITGPTPALSGDLNERKYYTFPARRYQDKGS